MIVIDAHVHVWDLERADYPWLDERFPALRRTFALGELAPTHARAGVDAAILVQAADNADDTAHLLAVAAAEPRVAGVVAWMPLDDPAASALAIDGFRDRPVVGVRTLMHDRADPHWILSTPVAESLDALTAAGLGYDVVTSGPDGMEVLPALAERHPGLGLVLDHLGKPPIHGDAGALARWRALLERASENPRLTAKLSGLYAVGADPAAWEPDDVRRVIEVAVEVLGPSRLMIGSDWPVALIAGGPDRALDAVRAALDGLSAAERADVRGGTAARVYGLDPAALFRAASPSPSHEETL